MEPENWHGGVVAIVPALNEEEPIGGVVREVLATGLVGEVIVVDNGSTDATAERATTAGARVVAQRQRGYGRACAAGVAALPPTCEVVVFLDGDGSDVPSELARLLAPIFAGTHDFVISSRTRGRREPGSLNATQLFAGWMAGALIWLRFGVRYTDMSPFRAIRRSSLVRLGMQEETYGWNLEMQTRAARLQLRILEIPVPHRCRRGGESKVTGNWKATLMASWRIFVTFLRTAARCA